MSAQYVTLFDATSPFPPNLLWFGFGLFVSVLATALAYSKGKTWPLAAAFGVLWIGMYVAFYAVPHWNLGRAIEQGRCKIVSGPVHNFVEQPADVKGPPPQSFDVGEHHFEYSQYRMGAPGYNRTVAQGAPRLEGKEVRICAIDGRIARLEVRSDF